MLCGDSPVAGAILAQTYRFIHRPNKAIQIYEEFRESAGQLEPSALAQLAELYEQTNQVEKAYGVISESVRETPNQPEPQLLLARIQRRLGDLGVAEEGLVRLTRRQDVPPVVAVHAWAELCHLLDTKGDYDGAVRAIEQCKAIVRQMPEAVRLSRQALGHNELFRRVYANVDKSTLQKWADLNFPAESRCRGIAHLLGFPRTGTTLLEQVLDAHPRLISSPERAVFSQNIFPGLYKYRNNNPLTLESIAECPTPQVVALRKRYLDQLEAILGEPIGGRVHLDKNPNHTSLLIGLYRLFPESRLLFAVRDPRDIIVSTYLRFFPLTEFSSCFLTWGSTCLIYSFDMSVWLRMRELLPNAWLEVRYEDTISDLETQARRALAFLGLEWDAKVLDYRSRIDKKVVNSPSHESVREPIYKHAVGRWVNYERYLGPYLNRLQPYLKAFGYE